MSGWSVCDGWALWIITSKHKHEFWQTCFTAACAHTPRSGVIHQSHRYWGVRALAAHSGITWKYLRALAPTHVGSHGAGGEILIFTKWLTLNTWFLHLWHPVCLFFFFFKDILFCQPLLLLFLLAVSIVTSLRQHLHTRYHLMSVPPPCSLCNEVSE